MKPTCMKLGISRTDKSSCYSCAWLNSSNLFKLNLSWRPFVNIVRKFDCKSRSFSVLLYFIFLTVSSSFFLCFFSSTLFLPVVIFLYTFFLLVIIFLSLSTPSVRYSAHQHTALTSQAHRDPRRNQFSFQHLLRQVSNWRTRPQRLICSLKASTWRCLKSYKPPHAATTVNDLSNEKFCANMRWYPMFFLSNESSFALVSDSIITWA